jgi:hypothetical protein
MSVFSWHFAAQPITRLMHFGRFPMRAVGLGETFARLSQSFITSVSGPARELTPRT